MEQGTDPEKKILIVYFSLSSQTKNLSQALITGLQKFNIQVTVERLEPVAPLRFPIGTILDTMVMMVLTFLRRRIPIQPLDPSCFHQYNLIILAGPTWSYNPSGPVLSLLDRDGQRLFGGKKVLPLISCRGYWRMHWCGLRHKLRKCGATVPNLMVFSHPNPEPWRTIGVFLKLAGKIPERKSWLRKYYRKYGHTKKQLDEAQRFGEMIGEAVEHGRDLAELDFKTAVALS